MAGKIDPFNKKQYGAVTAMLKGNNVKAEAGFYQKAFGFAKPRIMKGSDGKAIHAELTFRGTTLMLGPEIAHGFPLRKNNWRLADNFVSSDGGRDKTVASDS
jgi:uncharacterized glyoxalase superfamily protein PhnB